MKDLYTENHKTLMKKTEDNTNKRKKERYLCSWIGRTIFVKMPILPKTTYRFSAIPIKIQMAFFTEIEKTMIKLAWNKTKN